MTVDSLFSNKYKFILTLNSSKNEIITLEIAMIVKWFIFSLFYLFANDGRTIVVKYTIQITIQFMDQNGIICLAHGKKLMLVWWSTSMKMFVHNKNCGVHLLYNVCVSNFCLWHSPQVRSNESYVLISSYWS